MKQGDIVLVKWLDAVSGDDWINVDDIKDAPCEIHTCGIFIKETDDFIQVGLNYDTINNNFSCMITVPIGMVLNITQLSLPGRVKCRSKSKRRRAVK